MTSPTFHQHLIVILDPKLKIRSVNPSLIRRLGFMESDLIGKSYTILLAGKDVQQKLIGTPQALLKRENLQELNVTYHAKMGDDVGVLLSSYMLLDEKGALIGIACIAHSDTGIKQYGTLTGEISWYDALTQLPNRRYLFETLHRELEVAKRHHHSLAVLHVRLDDIKTYTSRLGNAFSDKAMLCLAQRVRNQIRKEDFAARLGDTEFVVLITHTKSYYDAGTLANKLLKAIESPIPFENNYVGVKASIGIVHFPDNAVEPDSLIQNAVLASHQAHELGQSNCKYFTSMLSDANKRYIEVSNGLNLAIDNKELSLVFQPIVDLQTGKIIALEALARWQHPTLGLIMPDEFIPIAEDVGLITKISQWVFDQVSLQHREWSSQPQFENIRVSFNASVRNLEDDRFTQFVADTCEKRGLSPDQFILELTETALITNVVDAQTTLEKLRTLGMRIAIDDFGAGYSSFSHLKGLSVNALKIDRTFLQNVTTDQRNAVIVKSALALGHGLGFDVVAEGVETKEQLDFLKQHGCTQAQGYYFCRPVAAKKLPKIIKDFA